MTNITRITAEKNLSKVKSLIESGVNIDSREEDGSTLLMCAVEYGYIEFVRMLLDKGAHVNATSNYGSTALAFAEEYEHATVIQLLISAGAGV